MTERRKVRLELELELDDVERLGVLAFSTGGTVEGRAREALLEFVDRVRDGVRRPGSWERPWLAQAFGASFTSRLEADPAEPRWVERVRR